MKPSFTFDWPYAQEVWAQGEETFDEVYPELRGNHGVKLHMSLAAAAEARVERLEEELAAAVAAAELHSAAAMRLAH